MTEYFQTPSSLLAQAHTTANVFLARYCDISRLPRAQLTDGSAPSTPLALASAPTHIKNSDAQAHKKGTAVETLAFVLISVYNPLPMSHCDSCTYLHTLSVLCSHIR